MRMPPPPPPPEPRPPSQAGVGYRAIPMSMPIPMPMQMPIRRESIRIQDITLPNASACLKKKLTTYHAYTIRKCPPRDPEKERGGAWARTEIREERLAQEDIRAQIKKLNDKGPSVTDKKNERAHYQQGQITTLVDNLASEE